MVFLAKSASPSEWKTVAGVIHALVEEATFEASVEGLNFRAMDPSHVALVDLVWPSSAFEKFECDKQVKFSVRVEDFVKLVRRAEPKDAVEISLADESALLLKITDGYKREFRLNLIESAYGPTPLPKLTFNARMKLKEQAFERVLNDVSAVSDHVTVEAAKDLVKFEGKSDSGSVSAILVQGEEGLLELDVKDDSKATYAISYLLNIVKAAGSSSDVVIFEYSSKMPQRLEFKLGEEGGRIHFYLAPRIEEK